MGRLTTPKVMVDDTGLIMRLHPAVCAALLAGIEATTSQVRPFDIMIGAKAGDRYDPENPRRYTPEDAYMLRWWVVPRSQETENVYFHHFLRSDDDRALHDHPWPNISILLEGDYIEEVPANPYLPAGRRIQIQRRAGDVITRPANSAHRVMLHEDESGKPLPVKSLFMTGPVERQWGFWCPQGWRHWKDFTGYNSTGDSSIVGPGCGEILETAISAPSPEGRADG